MEPNLTADSIYNIFQTLKKDGLSDADIKKALVQIFMGEQSTSKIFYFEDVATSSKEQSFFSKKHILYSIVVLFSGYLLYLFL
jgi:hypothetical protein